MNLAERSSHPGLPAPLFSVIILNWNGRQLLEECIDSALGQSFRDFELVLVDNGSTDGSAEWSRQRYGDRIRIIQLPENRGFAEGNNEGIRASRGQYVVLLNNDTAVNKGWLAALFAAVARHPEAGMFTPKILNYYQRDEIDNTGHMIYPDGLARGRHRLEKDDGRFDEEGEAAWPSGCAGVYRRDMLDEIGMLDETFFAYGEDVDLGLRARWAGWTCYYVPDAVVFHKYSSTSGDYSPMKAFLAERNRIWVLLKNFPFLDILFSPFRTAIRFLVHLGSAMTGQGAAGKFTRQYSAWRLMAVVLKAELAAVSGIPRVIRNRRSIQSRRRTSPREFRTFLRRFRLTAREAALKD